MGISRSLRELAITYLATRRGSLYVRTHHGQFAKDLGVSSAQLAALGSTSRDPAGPFDEDQRLVLHLVDDVICEGSASEATIAALDKRFGPQGSVEMVVSVAFYEAVCVINRSFAFPLKAGTVQLG